MRQRPSRIRQFRRSLAPRTTGRRRRPRARPQGEAANPHCKLTLARGDVIILCYPCLFPLFFTYVSLPFSRTFTTPFRRHTMRFNRSLGLTLIAAALVTVYGCGKEEPKKEAAAPAAPAAPAMPEVTVKVGHVDPTTGPQAHL